MKLSLQWSWLFGPRRTAGGALLGRRLSSEEHTRIFSKTMMLQWASSYLSLLIIKSFIFRNKRSHCKCNIIHMQDLHHKEMLWKQFLIVCWTIIVCLLIINNCYLWVFHVVEYWRSFSLPLILLVTICFNSMLIWAAILVGWPDTLTVIEQICWIPNFLDF